MNKFTTYTQPKLKLWKDYYDGKHKILNKKYEDESKACSNIVTNFCRIITQTYNGYIAGKPVSYSSNDDITDIQEVINYNDDAAANIQWLLNALIYGVGYEIQWIDKNAQTRYAQVNPQNAFPIYDNSLDGELLYFVRWYDANSIDDNEEMMVEVYSATNKKVYKMRGIGGAMEFVSEEAHFFKDVPVSIFWLNEGSEENIFNCIMGLNDSYNELQSAEVDDFSAFCDAYLALTGMDADKEEVAQMKSSRVLLLPEGGAASWLTKNASDTQVVNMLDNIKENIFKVSSCPDMADDNFMAQSGAAIRYKLVQFENAASTIVTQFTKAIQRRIELICNVLNLKASDAVWRDIQINFIRNLPQDFTETIAIVNSLKGVVSDATLLAQLPFIDDVQAELEAVQKQKADEMAFYGFGDNFYNEEEDDE